MADQEDREKIEKMRRDLQKGHKQGYTRRDFLKTAGVAAGLGAASTLGIQQLIQQNNNSSRPAYNRTPTGAATGENYETIEVGAGETFRKSLSDGETWENKLIDVSADGASYNISAVADNWEIRNIGVRGPMDAAGGQDTDFIVRVNSPNATGLVENIYLGYETTFTRSTSTSPMGMFVHAYHEGDLEVNNFYCSDMPSHAIYGSGPGNPSDHPNPGGNGTVRIHNSYAADLENSGWRIGTDGSYVENCVTFRAVRGVWAYYNDVEIRDCDLGDNGSDIVVGNGSWGNVGSATVDNTRFDPDNTEIVDNGVINGSSAGTPEERVPKGCPTTPEEAASGSGSTGGTGSGGSSKELDLPDEKTIVLEGEGNYIFETEGEIESGDGQIFENTATGILNGETHQYDVNGGLTDFRAEQNVNIQINDIEISRPQLIQLCQNPETTGPGSGGTNTGGNSSNNTSNSCTETDYEVIEVGAGETFTKHVGTGEAFENKLIDITASGATYQIHANGTNWKVRNIGVKGTYSGGTGTPFTCRDVDSNGESVIENVYLGDGADDAFQRNNDQVTGIYFHRDHAGDCLIKNVYVNEYRDNAIYASDPGHPEWENASSNPSGFGTVRIEDSYARNGGWNFRISTEGSYVKNCTSIITNSYNTGTPTCYKDYFSRGLEFIDCHAVLQTHGPAWTNGDGVWNQYQENQPIQFSGDCRYENSGSMVGGYNAGDWTGTQPTSGDARTSAPSGCPTSAEEAASCK